MTMHRRQWCAGVAAALVIAPSWGQGFDHSHSAWTRLLGPQVVLLRNGQASELRYAGMAEQREALRRYLASLSAVAPADFARFSMAQQMAFLINAYNAFTIERVLTRYPQLESIKDLGTVWSSPWKPKWIPLLGETMSLDDIEHGLLRKRGVYDDPRIHFAVNCASVGCPMLREEAYVADRLERQLEEQTHRFLSDRTRNRWNAAQGRLELSKIFEWYGDDFRLGHRGIGSLHQFAATHASLLADTDSERLRLRSKPPAVHFLSYDWRLNAVGAGA